MIAVGDRVTLTEPWRESYPDTYTVLAIAENGVCQIDLPGYGDGGASFDPQFLVKADA